MKEMRTRVPLLAMILVAGGLRTAYGQDTRPNFEGVEGAPTPAETVRLNTFGIVSQELSGRFFDTKWWRPVRGKFRYAVTYEDFFQKVGRPDLAVRHRHREVLSTSLEWGGLVVGVGGFVLFGNGVLNDSQPRELVGLGVLGAGLTCLLIGSALQPPVVSEDDARQMAEDYNRRLEVRFGGGPVTGATGEARQATPIGMLVSGRW